MKTRKQTSGKTPKQFGEALANVFFRHLPRHVLERHFGDIRETAERGIESLAAQLTGSSIAALHDEYGIPLGVEQRIRALPRKRK